MIAYIVGVNSDLTRKVVDDRTSQIIMFNKSKNKLKDSAIYTPEVLCIPERYVLISRNKDTGIFISETLI